MPDISPVYRPRKPRDSQYYQCVEDHFEKFEQVYDEHFSKQYGFFRPYVRQVIYRYLDCGILHNGFARVRCGDCGDEFLLAYSCKRRHFFAPSGAQSPPLRGGSPVSVHHAIKSGLWNSGSGSVRKSSRLSLTATSSSAYQRSSADISYTTGVFFPI